jgi:hypothetical protein
MLHMLTMSSTDITMITGIADTITTGITTTTAGGTGMVIMAGIATRGAITMTTPE